MKRRSKWVKVLVSVLLSVVLMVQMTGVAWGISKTIPLQQFYQTQTEGCCWACCGTSVCRYYGSTVTVEQFIYSVKYTYDRGVTGTVYEMRQGIQMNSGVETQSGYGILGYATIQAEIDANIPMIYSIKMYRANNDQHASHMILLSGYETIASQVQIIDSLQSIPLYHLYSDLITRPSATAPYLLETYVKVRG